MMLYHREPLSQNPFLRRLLVSRETRTVTHAPPDNAEDNQWHKWGCYFQNARLPVEPICGAMKYSQTVQNHNQFTDLQSPCLH